MSFPYDQYPFHNPPNFHTPYLPRWPQARYNQALMGNEQSHLNQSPHPAVSSDMGDGQSFTEALSPYTSPHPSGLANQQQQAFAPSLESVSSSQISSFTAPPPAYTPGQSPDTGLPSDNNLLFFSTPSNVSTTTPSPTFTPLKAPVAPKTPAASARPILSIKVKEPATLTASPPSVNNPATSIIRPASCTKPIEDIEMLDRDSPASASSSVSDNVLHHVLHLEEEAEEWKDRIEDLNTSLSTKSREITAMKEAITSMKAQKSRIQALLQKVDINMQKTLTQGQEMVTQKKTEEAEKSKLEQRLKERSELIEYLQDFRPASSTPVPATKAVASPTANKSTATPCPITHYDCPDCGCRMPKVKKDNHINSHCWGKCKNCVKEGLACNGGMSSKWTACFQCGQHGTLCVKPAKTREEAQEILKKERGRVDSLVA